MSNGDSIRDPQIGEIRKGTEVGFKSQGKVIWRACELCRKERWVEVRKARQNRWCRYCSSKVNLVNITGERNKNWKGGRIKGTDGYIQVCLAPDDFFFSMATLGKHRYVFEHRLVMAKHLGRCLHRWEIVHHKNHIRDDNRIENLQLVSDDRHKQLSILERRIVYLEQRVTLLEAENIILKERVSYV